jgi:hypothetical protein
MSPGNIESINRARVSHRLTFGRSDSFYRIRDRLAQEIGDSIISIAAAGTWVRGDEGRCRAHGIAQYCADFSPNGLWNLIQLHDRGIAPGNRLCRGAKSDEDLEQDGNESQTGAG